MGVRQPQRGKPNPALPPKPVAPPAPPKAGSSLPSKRGRPADNWESHNSRASDQNRVIAIRTVEGRYCHAACADVNKKYVPSKTSTNDLVLAHMVSRIAASGGMLCVMCDTFIVPPSNRRDILRAELMWEKANKLHKEGKITKEELAAAKRRFMSAATKTAVKKQS